MPNKKLSIKLQRSAVALCALAAVHGVQAADLTHLNTLTQTEFASLSKDITASMSGKALEDASPLGVTGFDVSAGMSATSNQYKSVWTKAAGGATDSLKMTRLSATKGLPMGIDIGAYTAKASNSNMSLLGVQAKYALLEGSAVTPAISLRGTYTMMSGVSQMGFSAMGAEALISKGFLGITPYAGVGYVRGSAKSKVANLTNETVSTNKTFVGLSWSILLVNMGLEYDKTGDASTLSAKLGLRW